MLSAERVGTTRQHKSGAVEDLPILGFSQTMAGMHGQEPPAVAALAARFSLAAATSVPLIYIPVTLWIRCTCGGTTCEGI
jgi:hypothetical protein